MATTRFPADAARRFAREADADAWRDRLRVVGCDFRDLGGVEALCRAVPDLLSDTCVCFLGARRGWTNAGAWTS